MINIPDMTTLGSRIKHFRVLAGLSQKALAKACGWESQSRVGNYEVDTREPTIGDIKLMADQVNVTILDLILTEEELEKIVDEVVQRRAQKQQVCAAETLKVSATIAQMPVARRMTPAEMEEPFNKENYVFIEQSSARLAAGHGEDNSHVEVRGELAFKKEWIRRKGLQVENLIIAYASGRSMEPLIHAQDAILINTAADMLKHDCVFYFRNAEHEAIIKRAMEINGEWILRSDNPDKSVKEHQDMPFVDEHGQQRFEIIGAAKWRGGDL